MNMSGRGHFAELFKDLMYKNIYVFPELIVEEKDILWGKSDYYTLVLGDADVIERNGVIVLKQELGVVGVTEDLEGEQLGDITFCIYLGSGELLRAIQQYRRTPDYKKDELESALELAVSKRIDAFNNGETVKNVRFVANRQGLLLKEEDILDAFVNEFGTQFGMFYVDYMAESELDDGDYYLEVVEREVVYSGHDRGWSVVLEIESENMETEKRKVTQLVYDTGIQATRNDPELEEFRGGVDYILDSFVSQYGKWDGLGVFLSFGEEEVEELPKENEEVEIKESKYKKIQGKEEDLEVWFKRIEELLGNEDGEVKGSIGKIEVIEEVGIYIRFKNGQELIFGAGGIMTLEGDEVYIKSDMNLQKGLGRLSKLLGRNNITLRLMKVYDYRRKVKEG